ncbi:MAG: hypothetical protein CV087_18095 [Candidatus Brocadia sp. WS118]|nr:MAG: hypothetical protein CV087_18095 [Candidatus Brocadia sp. WS118]
MLNTSFLRLTRYYISCTITKREERFKGVDSEIPRDNMHIVSQTEKDRITSLIPHELDKDRELRTDFIERISDQYRVNYFILDETYR